MLLFFPSFHQQHSPDTLIPPTPIKQAFTISTEHTNVFRSRGTSGAENFLETNINHQMAVSLRANPRPSYSLLDLPAEVRSVIYEHLLHSDEPSKVCIEWEISTNKLWSYVVVGLSKAGQERWRPIINRVQNATALMRTCSTLWSEVAPYLYDSTIFEFKAFQHPQALLESTYTTLQPAGAEY